jgi:hypothetical protein
MAKSRLTQFFVFPCISEMNKCRESEASNDSRRSGVIVGVNSALLYSIHQRCTAEIHAYGGGKLGVGAGARHALAPLPLQTYQGAKRNGREQMCGKVQRRAARIDASMDIELEYRPWRIGEISNPGKLLPPLRSFDSSKPPSFVRQCAVPAGCVLSEFG